MRAILIAVVCLVLGGGLVGIGTGVEKAVPEPQSIILFNITSDGVHNPHPVTMALQLAGHALDDGREAVLFFNVRGVKVPTKSFPAELAFSAKPITQLLAKLVERGAEVHVCPHCMKALEVTAEDLIPGAKVTNREMLFAKIGPNTTVFTY
jgi:predicted peroxiredoxin